MSRAQLCSLLPGTLPLEDAPLTPINQKVAQLSKRADTDFLVILEASCWLDILCGGMRWASVSAGRKGISFISFLLQKSTKYFKVIRDTRDSCSLVLPCPLVPIYLLSASAPSSLVVWSC